MEKTLFSYGHEHTCTCTIDLMCYLLVSFEVTATVVYVPWFDLFALILLVLASDTKRSNKLRPSVSYQQ